MSSRSRSASFARADIAPATSDERLLCTPDHGLGEDTLRLMHLVTELAEGFRALEKIGRAVSIFGSARVSPDEPEYELARTIARLIGARGRAIVTGGGPGIMEAANRGARDVGALSVGLSIELPAPQPVNAYLDLHVQFDHFFIRKLMFVRYTSAFVVLPGGFGTLDELFEAATLLDTAKMHAFPVVLAGSTYWDGLVRWLRKHALADGLIDAAALATLRISDDPAEIAGFALADPPWLP